MKKQTDKIPILLFLWCLFLCWLFVWREGVFGSRIDWISQHSVLPDYFRQLFYHTGNLFSNFAPQLGGGQNIFHYSYYGLYNPILLFSYFLPFVKMSDYIMWSSMICYGFSVVTFYFWIRKKCSKWYMAAEIAGMFSLAAPLLYHSYNHIMFVNYMPFLCLALIGTDEYLKKKKCSLLILGTAGMILCSFYFSIGGMLALVLYAVSEYCKLENSIKFRQLILWLFGYGIRLGIAVLICGILLVPTAFALGGERGQGIKLSLSWLIPEFRPSKLVFSPHGIGLSIMAFLVMIRGLFYKNWRERLLPVLLTILLIIPAFGYLLNGGLYAKTKVFIPFLPLFCYLFIPCIDSLKGKYKQIIGYMIPCISIIVLFVSDFGINEEAGVMVSRDFYHKVTSQEPVSWMEQEGNEDSSLYRTEELGDGEENKANINRIHCLSQSVSSIYSSAYNAGYAAFRTKTFLLNEPFRNNMMMPVTDNPCFLKFMGVKHLITQEQIPGYTLEHIHGMDNYWTGEDAVPVIYATNQLMEEQDYFNLPFPENQTTLLRAAVVQGEDVSTKRKSVPVFQEISCSIPQMDTDELKIQAIADGYEITAKKETEISINVDKKLTDDLFAASFRVENLNPNEDMHITVENQRNLLTASQHEYANYNEQFNYLLGVDKVQSQISIKFGKGSYRVHNPAFYIGSWSMLKDTGLCQHAFTSEDKQWKTKWDGTCYMNGTIQADEGSYLITSIPYDKGFTVFIDGERVKAEIVNTAFLGCKLEPGEHQIEIRYEAKGFRVGVLLSLFGICFCCIPLVKRLLQKAKK